MVNGINLTLMVGPAVPIPVPQSVLDALVSVSVTTSAGETASGFELTFTLSNKSPLHTIFLLAGGAMPPIMRVVLFVTIGGAMQVLMDGVMLETQIAPGSDSSHSTLTVRGKDLTALMNVIDFSGIPYPAMPYFARVALIVAKYAALGVVPLPIPEIVTDIPIPIDRIPRQQGKDLEYIQQLAYEAGYVFYLDPGPLPGMSVAYWGPQIKIGVPQPALNINMDAHTNVEALSFRFDKERKVMPIVFIQEELSKAIIPIPIPDITPLNPPLGLIPPIPPQIKPLSESAFVSPLTAVMMGLAEASRTSDAVFASGTLDVLRYGRPLKARQLVGVRGAGPAFDGLYYVNSVTHSIKRGEYKQSFELARNGLLSTLPRVPA
ncbi:MAG: hypothetical protein EYC68_18040 [Chloroflexota bacterium]|nr:MAG: hypothetical protein EYC68_18040 [Chloroflexota bacterium]